MVLPESFEWEKFRPPPEGVHRTEPVLRVGPRSAWLNKAGMLALAKDAQFVELSYREDDHHLYLGFRFLLHPTRNTLRFVTRRSRKSGSFSVAEYFGRFGIRPSPMTYRIESDGDQHSIAIPKNRTTKRKPRKRPLVFKDPTISIYASGIASINKACIQRLVHGRKFIALGYRTTDTSHIVCFRFTHNNSGHTRRLSSSQNTTFSMIGLLRKHQIHNAAGRYHIDIGTQGQHYIEIPKQRQYQ